MIDTSPSPIARAKEGASHWPGVNQGRYSPETSRRGRHQKERIWVDLKETGKAVFQAKARHLPLCEVHLENL